MSTVEAEVTKLYLLLSNRILSPEARKLVALLLKPRHACLYANARANTHYANCEASHPSHYVIHGCSLRNPTNTVQSAVLWTINKETWKLFEKNVLEASSLHEKLRRRKLRKMNAGDLWDRILTNFYGSLNVVDGSARWVMEPMETPAHVSEFFNVKASLKLLLHSSPSDNSFSMFLQQIIEKLLCR